MATVAMSVTAQWLLIGRKESHSYREEGTMVMSLGYQNRASFVNINFGTRDMFGDKDILHKLGRAPLLANGDGKNRWVTMARFRVPQLGEKHHALPAKPRDGTNSKAAK